MLADKTETILDKTVPDAIIDLLGRTWVIGGRGPENFDCWGLCIEVYKILGMSLPDELGYKCLEDQKKLSRSHVKDFIKIDYEQFCLVKFKPRPNWHAGVMLNRKEFIHITHDRPVSLGSIRDIPWRLWFDGFYNYNQNQH